MGVFLDRRGLLAGLLLSGCASAPRPRPPRLLPAGAAVLPELETLLAVRAEAGGLALVLNTNGCLRKEDLRFYVERGRGVASIAFARRRLEPCKAAAPVAGEAWFAWDELGLAGEPAVRVLNPLEPR